MKIELDQQVNALYVRLHDGDVAKTVEFAADVYLDVDQGGQVLGVEFVYADDLFALLARHEGQLEIPERVAVA